MPTYSTLEGLLDGLPIVEDDHVFAPVGPGLSPNVIQLLNERAALVEPRNDDEEAGLADERALGEGYTERRDSLDIQIADALAEEHPEAPRIRLRGLSDEDFSEAAREVADLHNERIKKDQPGLSRDDFTIETNLRYVSRAILIPETDIEGARTMRRKLNQGEWARLLDHINRLASANSEQASLPNS